MCEVSWAALKNFKTISVSSGILTFNAVNKYFSNKKATVTADFTLALQNIKNGGTYNLVIIKNTASDVVVTLPASSVVSSSSDVTITLTGATGTEYLIEFTNDGTITVFNLA